TSLEQAPNLITEDLLRYERLLGTLGTERNLPGVFVVNPNSDPIAVGSNTNQSSFPPPPQAAVAQAKQRPDQVALITPPSGSNIIGAVTGLRGYPAEVFLYVARPLDTRVTGYLAMTNDSVAEYRTLEA